MVTSPAMLIKSSTFFTGFGFFGDPLIWRGLDLLNKEFPHWQKLLEIRNTILKGVPTNAQLTITLLRVGEANKSPLPPPPSSDQPPAHRPKSLNGDDLALDASNEEIHEAIHEDPSETAAKDAGEAEKHKHRHGEHILGFFKATAKGGVNTKFGIDRAKATAGSSHAKDNLGILPKKIVPSGPVDFKGRYHGKKGWIFISTIGEVNCVSFSKNSTDGTGDAATASFSVPIEEIQELKKVGGLGWKAKIVVGWATGKTVADGLEIVDKGGHTWKLTAIQYREELFNRLVSLGSQKWESW